MPFASPLAYWMIELDHEVVVTIRARVTARSAPEKVNATGMQLGYKARDDRLDDVSCYWCLNHLTVMGREGARGPRRLFSRLRPRPLPPAAGSFSARGNAAPRSSL